MEDPGLLAFAIALLLYAVLSKRLDRWWVSMPAFMLVVGLVVGPAGLGLVTVPADGETVRTVAEMTLALMLFHDAVRIDLRALRRGYEVPLRLLGIGLPVMIVLGVTVAYGLMPALGLTGAALIATMLAPTDAALGEAVVSDTRVPTSIRQGLNIESGLNDGLCVPVFLVLLGLAAEPGGWESGTLMVELLRQIGFGLAGGLIVGGGGGLLFSIASRSGLMNETWRRIAIVSIAIGCFVAAAALGGSGFIGAFSGGVLFGLASEARSSKDNAFTGYLGYVLDAASFTLLGAVILPFAVPHLTWQAVAYAVLSLTVIRMVAVVVAMLGTGARWQTLAFMGWFGPRGLATLVFAVMLLDEHLPLGNPIAAVALAGVTLSVVAHGFSAPPLVSWYSASWRSVPSDKLPAIESADVHEHGLRKP